MSMQRATTFFSAKEWKEVEKFLREANVSLYALLKDSTLKTIREATT